MRTLLALLTAATLLVVGGVGTAVLAANDDTSDDRHTFADRTSLQLRTKLDRGMQVLNVRDASDVVRVSATLDDAVTAPWHTHPGPVLIFVNTGEFHYQHADCSVDVYHPGEIAIDPGDGYVHRAHFTAGTDVDVMHFGVPPGEPATDFDVEAPDCPDLPLQE